MKTNLEMITLVRENGLIITECDGSKHGISGKLYQAGIIPIY
jgi:hypothetical protein